MVYEIEEALVNKHTKRVVVRLLQFRHLPNLSKFDAFGNARLSFKKLRVRLLPQNGLNPMAEAFFPAAMRPS